jgi:hypothetical protein
MKRELPKDQTALEFPVSFSIGSKEYKFDPTKHVPEGKNIEDLTLGDVVQHLIEPKKNSMCEEREYFVVQKVDPSTSLSTFREEFGGYGLCSPAKKRKGNKGRF